MTELDIFIAAVQRQDIQAAGAMLDRNADLVRQQDASGATALHYAAFNGSRDAVRLLVERGADVNARDAELGATPAGWAIEYLRELGGHLAIELEDLAFAIQEGDIRWVSRFLARFPHLRTGMYRAGISFRQLANDSGDPRLIELFADGPPG